MTFYLCEECGQVHNSADNIVHGSDRQAPPPRPGVTLTDEEREALRYLASYSRPAVGNRVNMLSEHGARMLAACNAIDRLLSGAGAATAESRQLSEDERFTLRWARHLVARTVAESDSLRAGGLAQKFDLLAEALLLAGTIQQLADIDQIEHHAFLRGVESGKYQAANGAATAEPARALAQRCAACGVECKGEIRRLQQAYYGWCGAAKCHVIIDDRVDVFTAEPVPPPTETGGPPVKEPRTLHECRLCPRSGDALGARVPEGWGRLVNVDGPDAVCPSCTREPTALDALVEEYPNVRLKWDGNAED